MLRTGRALRNLALAVSILAPTLCILALAGCGGTARESGAGLSPVDMPDAMPAPQSIPASEHFPPPASDTPSLDELQAVLDSELLRLGIDPQKSALQAPLGDDNAVFDLRVSYFDLRQGAVLHWTERLLGDYDMNGLVNAADLTSLAQCWKYTVDYRDPAEAGVAWWPVGNPRDGGLSGILDGRPGFMTPADQWRTARVDGDGNGELNLADVTPLARHWQQSLDSWRIYRRAPAEQEFSLLLPDPELDYSLPRSANFPAGQGRPDNHWAYRLHFADLQIGPGEYSYYITAYDSQSGSEGPPSAVVTINFEENPGLPEPEIPGNKPPVASFTVDPRTGDLPLTVNFDASKSTDPDGQIVLYLWDFDGDGTADESGNNLPTVSHVYTEPGYWQPRLTIWDDLGSSATLYANINLEISQDGWLPPRILDIGADLTEGRAPLTVHFLPELVLPNGKAGLQFAWDFDGDGTVDSTEPALDDGIGHTDDSVEHVYGEDGPQQCRLTITDNKGLSANAELEIEVFPNGYPVAVLEVVDGEFTTRATIQFDASGSSDPDGDKLSFRWDFDGDGIFEEDTGFVDSAKHLFPDAGEHHVGVRVRDTFGAETIASVDLSVEQYINLAPVAILQSDRNRVPINGSNRTVSLDPSQSFDPDGRITIYRWDVDGDGEFELSYEHSEVQYLDFDEPGEHVVTLEVEDRYGARDQASVTITAFLNHPPVAELHASPDSGVLPLDVFFDASGSYDQDGDQLTFLWFFDFGFDEAVFQGEAQEHHVYHVAGRRTCAVVVDDGWGESDYVLLDIQVSGPGWNTIPLSVFEDEAFEVDCQLEYVDSRPLISYSQYRTITSRYPDLVARQAADSNGLVWLEPVIVEANDNSTTGSRRQSMVIFNDEPVIAWQRPGQDIVFSAPVPHSDGYLLWQDPRPVQSYSSGPLQLSVIADRLAIHSYEGYSRAQDVDAGSWSSWHIPEFMENMKLVQLSSLTELGGLPALAYCSELDENTDTIGLSTAATANGIPWKDNTELMDVKAVTDVCMAVISGKPAIAYGSRSGIDGIYYIASQDETGSSWLEPVFLPLSEPDSSLKYLQNLFLLEMDGRALLVDAQMGMWMAADPQGLNWSERIAFPLPDAGTLNDVCIVNGNPALAYISNKHLFYAVYLP
ncbi:MAG: PKD domain-containing protein [bacterium]